MITIYIDGFGGSGKGIKTTLFENYFKPSLSYIPDLAKQMNS